MGQAGEVVVVREENRSPQRKPSTQRRKRVWAVLPFVFLLLFVSAALSVSRILAIHSPNDLRDAAVAETSSTAEVIVPPLASKAPPPEAQAEGDHACPPDMVLIEGDYCPGLAQPCQAWVRGGVQRCAQFGNSRCTSRQFPRRFCIDRYEYPNLPSVKPAVMVTWYDALRACDVEGKRLCLASEWTLACEGAQRFPYPYGYKRDKTACNFDRPRPIPEPNFHVFRQFRKVGREVARLDQRVESGLQPNCVSPFEVHDLVGNVDEWVLNEWHFDHKATPDGKRPVISGLKGGYWGPIRAACRPMTTAHEENFYFYQVGFRCCANARTDPDGVADRYTSRLGPWREIAGLERDGVQ